MGVCHNNVLTSLPCGADTSCRYTVDFDLLLSVAFLWLLYRLPVFSCDVLLVAFDLPLHDWVGPWRYHGGIDVIVP